MIFERAKLNQRRQEEGEPVDSFITALAEHCAYGALHNEMIRDHIVVGIRSSSLSDKLQCRQEEGESVDSFVTTLYALAEHCAYGALHNNSSEPSRTSSSQWEQGV